MAIKVKFFANLRERTGKSEETVEFSDGMTASDIWSQVVENMDMPEDIMVAVNMDYIKGNPPVKDNDEVAFFPPVTGG